MPAMRALAQLIGVFIAGFWSASTTYAYGPLGHEIVGDIATTYLCGPAATEVQRLLDGDSLGLASRWPDWIRRDPQWRKSRPWHFINVADNGRISDVTGQPDGDVIWAIRKFRHELADRGLSDSRRAEALRFLAHFVADVHQPLHVGRYEDRGGNKITVMVGDRKSNLHKFWDAQQLLKEDRKNRGVDAAGQIASIRSLADGRIDALQADGVVDWARESKALRPTVYVFTVPAFGAPVEIDGQYSAATLEVSRLRLAAAGVRLAGTLNGIFCQRLD